MEDFSFSDLLLQDSIMEQPSDDYSTSPSNSAVIYTPPSGDDLPIYDSLDLISPEETVSDPDQIASLADRMLNFEENFGDSAGHLLDELAGQNLMLGRAEPGGFYLGAEHQVNALPLVNNAEPSHLEYRNNALQGLSPPQSIENEAIPTILPQARVTKKKTASKDLGLMAIEQAKAVAEKERLIQEANMRKNAVEEGQCFGISTTRSQNDYINWTPATMYSIDPNQIQGAWPTFTNPLRIPQMSNNIPEAYAIISGNQTHWSSSAQTQYLENGNRTSPQLSLPSTYQFAQRLQTHDEIGGGSNVA